MNISMRKTYFDRMIFIDFLLLTKALGAFTCR